MHSSALLLSLLSLLPATVFARPAAAAATTTALPTVETGLSLPCKPLTVIFARGTDEDGNVGSIAGPPWFAALRADLGTSNVAVQGVNYTASIIGYLEGGDPTGSTTMLNLINQAATQCPSTKIVLGGYSQGAQLVHNAAAKLTAAVTKLIAAVVVFGDPDNGEAIGTISSSLVYNDCHAEDIICTGSGGAAAHLTYGADAAVAASFVVGKVGTL